MFEKDKANTCFRRITEIVNYRYEEYKNTILKLIRSNVSPLSLEEYANEEKLGIVYQQIESDFFSYFKQNYGKEKYMHRFNAAIANPEIIMPGMGSISKIGGAFKPQMLAAIAVYALTGTAIEANSYLGMGAYCKQCFQQKLYEISDVLERM